MKFAGGGFIFVAGMSTSGLLDYYQGLVDGGYIWILWIFAIATFLGGVGILAKMKVTKTDNDKTGG